jgi:FAD/FMN-containing dehydrogenase
VQAYLEYGRKCERVHRQLRRLRMSGQQVRLGKPTSNLFRARAAVRNALDVRSFNRVLSVDPETLTADVEGMTPYDRLVEETLRYGLLPAIVPQLKSITVGGAVSGVGIESSSFRYGLVHETVREMDILAGDGRMVPCSPGENADLFYGFPNSYGTLGYALRVRIGLIPAQTHVHLTHTRFKDSEAFFERLSTLCRSRSPDYLDGVVFGPSGMYTTEGTFADQAPYSSDYTWMRLYYRSIQSRREDWLKTADYIWRWDTDWFWCSKNLYAQNPVVRLLATPMALNSRTYQRVMRASQRIIPDRGGAESVIQDVDIPIHRAAAFLRFLLEEIGIKPIWICPVQTQPAAREFDLYALDAQTPYVNFGFWDVIPSAEAPGHYNRLVESKLVELGGKKGLYSKVCFEPETFSRLYNGERYLSLKQAFDPEGVFETLYEKCTRS